MRCLSEATDWGLIFMFSAATFGFGLTIGKLWGERVAGRLLPRDGPPSL